jgi:hypothetical protein
MRPRSVDEAALLESLHAFLQHPVGHGDALAAIDLAQALDQVCVAAALVEFARDDRLLVADRVHHVHGEHELVEVARRRLHPGGRGRERRVRH